MTLFNIITTIGGLLNAVLPILIALATVYFVWGVIQYTLSTDEEAKTGARAKIIQGLIGLILMLSFWGIVKLVLNTAGLGNTGNNRTNIIDTPCSPVPGFPAAQGC